MLGTASAALQDGASISLQDARRTFSGGGKQVVRAVDGVTLDVAAGSTVALMGASGSGKSTLLHLVAAIERADAGRVQVGDVDLTVAGRRELLAHRRRIGLVFQRFHLIPALTVLDNVLAPVIPYRDGFDSEARAIELLEGVGLAGRERDLPSRLSGGQQQRVAIARALINRPQLLLADEPTGSLDSATGAVVIDLVLGLRASTGATILLATHDRDLAQRCDRVVEMRDGKLV